MATLSITLGFAAQGGCVACLRLLLRAGADASAEDRETSTTPLHVAAELGRDEAVAELLAGGARLDCRNNFGKQPEAWAMSLLEVSMPI